MRSWFSPGKFLFVVGCWMCLGALGLASGDSERVNSTPSRSEAGVDQKNSQLKAELLEPKDVELLSGAQLRQVLAHHRGKVVVLNLWATWCIPCVKEMPDLSKLQETYADKGLKVIGLSLDDSDELETRVRPFFKKRSVGFISYLQAESDPMKMVSAIDDRWDGVLPTTYFFDGAGKLRHKLVGSKTYEQFETLIKPLLETANGQ